MEQSYLDYLKNLEIEQLIWTIIALFVVTIFIVFINLFTNRTKKDTFLILGQSDSGKTLLYVKLRYKQSTQTHTSMKENEGYIMIEDNGKPLIKEPIHIVDVPGHEKLRFKFLDFVPITRGIIFLIDSSTCVKNDISKRKIPILIACNKSDLITALPPERIQPILENEINRLRSTRTAALDHQDSSEDVEFLGYENNDFKFEHLENEMQFEKCSVENEEFKEIKEWIAKIFHNRK
ncbi:4745_t:CDS:2 [Diversispora eburnea]|uniref:Signal recognition particle receptor subunit beta n=1 Tax=Diversispora eburnea TaxID=1213867 RepID=A0A9N8YHX6_9GLOM|nr:4745_t:CDS:2 [Diversispora eburnea]